MRWEKYLVTSKTIKDIDEDEGVAPARCACFHSSLYVHLRDTDYSYQNVRRWSMMMMIAFITFKSSLVPLLEGL